MRTKGLITLSEGALMYGRSRMAFVVLVESRRIQSVWIGKRKFVYKEDVEQLIKNRAAKEHQNSYIEPVQRSA